MTTIVRCMATAIGLLAVAVGVAAEKKGDAELKIAVDALLSRLDAVNHDPDMTTAKKAVVAAEAMEKFNQHYKGRPLTVRLRVLDVVPGAQGQYLTANSPDLQGVQFNTAKFQARLSNAEVMSITKESVLAVTGAVNAASSSQPRLRLDSFKQGGSIAFPLRSNRACQICLENVAYRLETAPSAGASFYSAGKTTGDSPATDKLKNEKQRTVDDIKVFFLKGIFQAQHSSGSGNSNFTARTGTGQYSGSATHPSYGSGSNYGSNAAYGSTTGSNSAAKTRRNHVYSAAELILKFGNPSSRTSSATSEQWTYKCKDGVVHVHFTEVGVAYARSSSTSKSETVRLEIKSVDSSSLPSTGMNR